MLFVVSSAVLLAACSTAVATPTTESAATPVAAEPTSVVTEQVPEATTATGEACADPPPCDNCSNYPYAPTDCWTTDYGPARANVILGSALQSTNMLYCEGGTYALCFFSGPLEATGTNPENKPLPCHLVGDVAKCTCKAFTSGAYFVDINSILNLGAYFETVQICGKDGSACANIVNCGTDGSVPGCQDQKPAPVCGYIKNQNPDDAKVSLMPNADLISAFSFAMDGDYMLGGTPCTGLYAGCMTAACKAKDGDAASLADGDLVECDCPTYTGTYQIGQSGMACVGSDGSASPFVWSAANSVMDTAPE
jgi:hypothetical protein